MLRSDTQKNWQSNFCPSIRCYGGDLVIDLGLGHVCGMIVMKTQAPMRGTKVA
jgi:hypothetical protein